MHDIITRSNSIKSSTTWLLLGIAVLLEIAGALGLRFSEGFTLFLPTMSALLAFAGALYLVSKVMKTLPVSIAYPIWAGGGTVGVALIGVLALGEDISSIKILGIVLVIFGVVLINMTSEKKTGC